MNAQLAATVLGLSLSCADMHLTWNEERNFWKSPVKLIQSPAHWLYVLSRYFAIAAQMCDIIIASIWKYKYTAIPANICHMHLVFKSVVSHFGLLILDIILMLRVYALYSKSQEIALFIGLALLTKLTSGVWISVRLKEIATSSIYFNYVCIAPIPLHEEPGVALFVFGEMAIHGALCWLTLTKTCSLLDFWPRAQNIATVLNRDALSVFLAIFALFTAVIISTYRRGLAVLFVYPVFISIMSCGGCRLILHLFRFGGQETLSDSENVVLTSVDATGTWDTRIHPVRPDGIVIQELHL
ncbi:hypothetical protein L218DRAFT_400375 [Marasmius fiardii PR-910]|nr:hypothetical protein L218DRAFT_400375 [Marasmius fiardii PR-910]